VKERLGERAERAKEKEKERRTLVEPEREGNKGSERESERERETSQRAWRGGQWRWYGGGGCDEGLGDDAIGRCTGRSPRPTPGTLPYVSIRQQIRQHKSAYVSAYVSIRQMHRSQPPDRHQIPRE
jgi:hypothetical protein